MSSPPPASLSASLAADAAPASGSSRRGPSAATLYFEYLWFPLKQRLRRGSCTPPPPDSPASPTPKNVTSIESVAGLTANPDCPVEEVEAAIQETAAAIAKQGGLSYDHRIAIRVLFYSSVTDETLRDTFDGMLLPPPYTAPDYTDHLFSRDEVVGAAKSLPLDLRPVVLRMPMNLALKSGVYDARLRAVMRRLCHLYEVPFATIEQREEMLCDMDWAEDQVKVKKGSRISAARVLKIGAFTVVGGVALFFTGGLAAPLVAPAFGALIGATASTVAVVGSVGAAMGGTVAAVFAGIVGIATQAAALAVLITPALTAANVTAIIGAGGAGLGGWKAAKRTAGVDGIKFRELNSIETLPPIKDQMEDLLGGTYAAMALDAGNPSSPGADPDRDEDHSGAFKGVLVPRHVRTTALLNIAASPKVKDRRRVCAVAVDNDLGKSEVLRLKASYLQHGRWVYAPVSRIPPGAAGVSMSSNRHNTPTGTGGCLCYVVEGKTTHMGYRIWLYAYISLAGTMKVSALVAPGDHRGTPQEFYKALEETADAHSMTFQFHGLMVEARTEPKPHFIVRKSAVATTRRNPAFASREIEQRLGDIKPKLKDSRRTLCFVVKNNTPFTLDALSMQVPTGVLHRDTPPVSFIGSEEAALFALFNTPMTPGGAEATVYLALDTDDGSEDIVEPPSSTSGGGGGGASSGEVETAEGPATTTGRKSKRMTIVLRGEISAINNVLGAAAVEESSKPIREITAPKLHKMGKVAEVLVDETHGVKITWEHDAKAGSLTFTVSLATAADAKQKTPRMSLTIGVTGFITTLDHRRKLKDQQVALFYAPFTQNTSGLFSASELLVLQWEDELQQKFAHTVGLNVEDSVGTKISQKAQKKVKKTVVNTLIYKTFIGASVRAFEAMSGAFAMPLYAVWGADAIDNTYATLVNRSESAGVELAAALTSELRGNRPVTLVGFSFGCNVIYECLRQLHKVKAFGIVENVYLLGAIIPSTRSVWQVMRETVAGRVVNVYNRSDWLLHFIHHGNLMSTDGLSGLTKINVAGVENIDCSSLVSGHSDYASKLDEVLCLIPREPTPESMELDRMGAPGAAVPVAERHATATRIFGSMTGPILARIGACVVTVANRTKLPLALLHSEVFGGQFDFLPPGRVLPGHSGLCGCVMDPELWRMSGFVAYGAMLPLMPPATDAAQQDQAEANAAPPNRSLIVLITFFHYHYGKRIVTGTSKALLVHVPPVETPLWFDDENLMQRVRDMLSATVHGPSEIQQMIDDAPDVAVKCANPREFGEAAPDATGEPDVDDLDHLVTNLGWRADGARRLCAGQLRMLCTFPNKWEIATTLLLDVDSSLHRLLEEQAEAENDELASSFAGASGAARINVGRCVPLGDLMDALRELREAAFASKAAALAATATSPTDGGPLVVPLLFPFVIVNGSDNELCFVEFGDGQLETLNEGVRWSHFAPPVIPPQSAAIMALAPASHAHLREVLQADSAIPVASCAYSTPRGRYLMDVMLQRAQPHGQARVAAHMSERGTQHVDPTAGQRDATLNAEVELTCKSIFVPIDDDEEPDVVAPDDDGIECGNLDKSRAVVSAIADHKVVEDLKCLLLMIPANCGFTPPVTPRSAAAAAAGPGGGSHHGITEWHFF